MPRIFIAIKLPDEIIQKITGVAHYFQTQLPPNALKWVETENLHLTLKFLGEIPEKKLTLIEQTLALTATGHRPFKISVAGLGIYPNIRQPRVIWLGIQGIKPVIHLHDNLEIALEGINLEKENRPFNPHLTLGRVRQRISRETAHQIGQTLSAFKVDSLGGFEVGQIYLIESQLTPKGPIYTTRFTAPLSEV